MFEAFWDEYDATADAVASSGHKFISNNLKRWLTVLASEPLIATEIAKLESSLDFANWYSDCTQSGGSMVGSATLDFPLSIQERLGAFLFVLRKAVESNVEPMEIAHTFISGNSNFDVLGQEFLGEIFQPARTELRRYLFRTVETGNETPQSENRNVPASDRIVGLDHNSITYTEAIESLNRLRDAVAATNDYIDEDDKAQQVAELSAGQRLLDAPRVRLSAVKAVLWNCLKYLADKFADTLVGKLVEIAIIALLALIGIHLFT